MRYRRLICILAVVCLIFAQASLLDIYGILKVNADDEVYLKGRDIFQTLRVTQLEEKDLVYMVEAEDTMFTAPMEIGEDEVASGGKYLAAPEGSRKLDSPDMDQNVHIRLKFYVSQRGEHTLFMRLRSLSDLDSWWASFDFEPYRQVDRGSGDNYSWTTGFKANLDVGWHIANIKYREATARIDNIIISGNEKFSPTGLGNLPGEPERPTIIPKTDVPKILVNGKEARFDTPPFIENKTLFAPAKSILMAMGVNTTLKKDELFAVRGRDYLKATAGDRFAIINGSKYNMKAAPKGVPMSVNIPLATDEVSILMPLKFTVEAFGGRYSYNEQTNVCEITFDLIEGNVREAQEGEIIFYPLFRYFGYEIPYPNGDDVLIEVHARRDDSLVCYTINISVADKLRQGKEYK